MMTRKKMHDQYGSPHVDMPAWVLDRYQWKGTEAVLDVGSGPGIYLESLLPRIENGSYTAGDLSAGMAKSLKTGADVKSVSVFDAQNLPLPG